MAAAQPQPISKLAPTAVAPNSRHLLPLAEVPTPEPSPSPSHTNTSINNDNENSNSTHAAAPPPTLQLPNKNKDLPPTPPRTGRSSPITTTTTTTSSQPPNNPHHPPAHPHPLPLPASDTSPAFPSSEPATPAALLPHPVNDDPFVPHSSHLYGRSYTPHPDDFRPPPQHVQSTAAASVAYWERFLATGCTAETMVVEPVGWGGGGGDGNGNGGGGGGNGGPGAAIGRWVFAVGGCVVKTNHFAVGAEGEAAAAAAAAAAAGRRRRREYAGVDANEVAALGLVRGNGEGEGDGVRVRVPRVYFAGKLLGGDVLVQERLPGVSLEVAWPYLDREAKRGVRREVRAFARRLAETVVRHDGGTKRAYVVDDYSAIWARALTPRERRLMLPPPPSASASVSQQRAKSAFAAGSGAARAGIGWGTMRGGHDDGGVVATTTGGKRKDSGLDSSSYSPPPPRRFQTSTNVFHDSSSSDNDDPAYSLDHPDSDTRFAHNDLSTSNIIVDRGEDGTVHVVGIIDWEHAGWIGWRTTAAVHRELRAPLVDMYDREEFDQEEWEDLVMWKGLYDDSDDE
ncbi:phd transcription factor [Diplodia corticola]|uniref:Phd transcription factor n=1 Tax=Diplodia corticola TaxID=236234 RepID=A0A1J9RR90_9PEZI|nr:phd transcription factor [Diplodia corticola]OJD30053.1 phd transcription factor [Diplodia corticola]